MAFNKIIKSSHFKTIFLITIIALSLIGCCTRQIKVNKDRFKVITDEIDKYYAENKKYPLDLNKLFNDRKLIWPDELPKFQYLIYDHTLDNDWNEVKKDWYLLAIYREAGCMSITGESAKVWTSLYRDWVYRDSLFDEFLYFYGDNAEYVMWYNIGNDYYEK